MSNYEKYSRFIVRSVDHIFKNFLNDANVEEVYESQFSGDKGSSVAIEIEGTLSGELIFYMPVRTLDLITRKMVPHVSGKSIKKHHPDIAGEIANLISGTFANQLQFLKHNVRLSAPEFDDDPIALKAFYENINLSFKTSYGGFDIDLYYKEKP